MNLSRQFTRREKILLVVLVVLMLVAGYYLAVYRPVTDALARLESAQSELETELVVLEAKQRLQEEMQAELDALLEDPNTAEIPPYNNLEQLALFLNATLSSTTDYSLSFQQTELSQEQSIVRRTIAMQFTCPGYAHARDVVMALRHSPYRCQLGSLAISPDAPALVAGEPQASMEQAPVQVSLTITFFESQP